MCKVMISKGGVADLLIDILVECSVDTRDRIVHFDKDIHFASIVYRTKSWSYAQDEENSRYSYVPTDMELVRRIIVENDLQSKNKKNCVLFIKRRNGHSRSTGEHSGMATCMTLTLNKLKLSTNLHIKIFDASRHVPD